MNKYYQLWKVCLCLACLLPMTALSQVSFVPLGDLPGGDFKSLAFGVSANGQVVVGRSVSDRGEEPFVWDIVNGMEGLGKLNYNSRSSQATATSADGSIIVGFENVSNTETRAFIWTRYIGIVDLGDFPSGRHQSTAKDISADGRFVVGQGMKAGTPYSGPILEAYIWDPENGMTGLVDNSNYASFSSASAVSADGSVVVGIAGASAFRWDAINGMVSLGTLPGRSAFGIGASARDVSADGSIVVGSSNSSLGTMPFIWSADSGMISLGSLDPAFPRGTAEALSGNGLVVAGISSGRTFIWNPINGMQNIRTILEQEGVDLTGWHISRPTNISYDGQTIVGHGVNPDGKTEAWLARIPLPISLQLALIENAISRSNMPLVINDFLQARLDRINQILVDNNEDNNEDNTDEVQKDKLIMRNLYLIFYVAKALRGILIPENDADNIIISVLTPISCLGK